MSSFYEYVEAYGYQVTVISGEGIVIPTSCVDQLNAPDYIKAIKVASIVYSLRIHLELALYQREDYYPFDLKGHEHEDALRPYVKRYHDTYLRSNAGKAWLRAQEKQRQKPRRQVRAGYIYVIQSQSGEYKIGLSETPKKRISKLEVKLPFDIEVIHLIQTDDMHRLESSLHMTFEAKRVRGEWFALDSEDVDYIKQMTTMMYEVDAS